jgi:transcriptional regulator with XRE-family HTH domain
MSVGARIRIEREARKISQVELAKRAGLSSVAIWNWEARGRVPHRRTLAKVAKALNVSERYLAEGRNDADPPYAGTTKAIRGAPEGDPAARGPEQGSTVAEVLDRTRMRIAELTGFDPDQIKLPLTITS